MRTYYCFSYEKQNRSQVQILTNWEQIQEAQFFCSFSEEQLFRLLFPLAQCFGNFTYDCPYFKIDYGQLATVSFVLGENGFCMKCTGSSLVDLELFSQLEQADPLFYIWSKEDEQAFTL